MYQVIYQDGENSQVFVTGVFANLEDAQQMVVEDAEITFAEYENIYGESIEVGWRGPDEGGHYFYSAADQDGDGPWDNWSVVNLQGLTTNTNPSNVKWAEV